jgi:phage-related protein (TIGR01555 family)
VKKTKKFKGPTAVDRQRLEARVAKLERALKAVRADKYPEPLKISPEARIRSRAPLISQAERERRAAAYAGTFTPARHPPQATPAGHEMAMDDWGVWAGGGGSVNNISWSAYAEGQEFLGYPTLSLMAQRGEFRTIVSVLATAMTRKWIKIKSTSDDDAKQDKINQLDRFMKKLRVRQHFKRAAELDFYFGRGHLFLEFGGTRRGIGADEIRHSVGWGDDEATRGKVGRMNPLTAVRPVEPVWVYPMSYNTNDPLSPHWYKPEVWYVLGKEVHGTRLLRFVMDEVSDLLKPAYSFGGLSKTQIAKPYVDNWLTARQSVADILKGFTTYVLKTNLAATLRGGTSEDLYDRIDIFANLRTNSGVMAVDMETEDFGNVSVPLSGLDRLQSQALEFIPCMARIPIVYYTGQAPSGLNATSRDDMMIFNETIHSFQEVEFEDNLRTVFHHCQMSLWDEIDEDLDFEFLPLMELTEIEKAQKRQVDAAVDATYVEMGAIDGHDVRERIAKDPDSLYPGLDPDEMPEQPAMPGLEDEQGQKEGAEQDALAGLAEDPWERWVRLGRISDVDPFERLQEIARAAGPVV